MRDSQSGSLTERVYYRIREDIIFCRHMPGEKLRINSLCEELKASLGAVREALSRLAAEGFVVAEAQKGFAVSPVSLRDLEDLIQTRVTIEGMCLTRAIAHGGLEWETGIVASFHRLSRTGNGKDDDGKLPGRWEAAHKAFHTSLVAACDSEWLLRIRAALYDQSERYRLLTLLQTVAEGGLKRQSEREHRALMDAVLKRDAKTACELMSEHLANTAETAAQIVGLVANGEAVAAAPDRRH